MRILYVTTISLTMNSFFKPHIEMLVREGNQVDLACNDRDLPLDGLYSELGCGVHRIDFSRSPLNPDNFRAYGQLSRVIEKGGYDIVHCHTPNAAVITRLVCRKFRKKTGLKVFYTAHGFHFYKGAPMLNWMVYYPVEKFCSRYTDKLITINTEDYELAKKKFKAGEVHYVPGVGIDLSRFENVQVDREAKRHEIGVPEDAFLLFSVGELNENKNHQVILRAVAALKNPKIHYAVAGVGDKKEALLTLAEELGVAGQLHLLGYRKDIPELNHSADVFCFPSYREGLSVSLMEAMACRLPCIVSRIRGNIDLIDENGGNLFNPYNQEECKSAILSCMKRDCHIMGEYNNSKVRSFDTVNVNQALRRLYFGNR
ncbi:MAG: glycosyltransferase family 4 protein [Clostridia bacterium]|nr:glycosyltransferase family 4 protein [Clostridia bacterium]